jgi:DNA-binding Lrp family transcriptional regulator
MTDDKNNSKDSGRIAYGYHIVLDEIDKVILSMLGKNANISSYQIASELKDMGYNITDSVVRQILQRLEKSKVVLGYSAILNPKIVSEKVNRTMVLKFKFSENAQVLVDRLKNYLEEAPFCLYSARLTNSGDFDCVAHLVFDSIEQYELEINNFLHRFVELISDYRLYESKMIKASHYTILDEHDLNERKWRVYKILDSTKKYENINDKLQIVVESLVKYFDAKFARLWIVDKKRQNLILKFSSGKYKNIDGEFSSVSIDSLKIGPIVKTKKPAITNDVVNDPRIRYPEWAKKENLKSFAGYPLIYNGESVGVLAMFSEKILRPSDFELLGMFCDHLSKDLSVFFDALKIVKQQQDIFDILSNNVIPANQRTEEIEGGIVETIHDPVKIRKLAFELIKCAMDEILISFSTVNVLCTQFGKGIMKLLEQAALSQDSVKIRMLSPMDNQVKETTQKLKEQQQINIRYSKQYLQTKPTILMIIDNALSLIIDFKDDKKQNSYEAIGLASYSNNKSTILSCTAIFEKRWMQAEFGSSTNVFILFMSLIATSWIGLVSMHICEFL